MDDILEFKQILLYYLDFLQKQKVLYNTTKVYYFEVRNFRESLEPRNFGFFSVIYFCVLRKLETCYSKSKYNFKLETIILYGANSRVLAFRKVVEIKDLSSPDKIWQLKGM